MLIDPQILAQLLASADPKVPVTLTATAPAGVWRQMLGVQVAGPENLSTRQCAQRLGWSDKDWRRWAPAIPGAVQDGNGRWRIPAVAAKEEADRRMKRGVAAGKPITTSGPRRGGNYGKVWSLKKPQPVTSPENGDGA